MTLNTSQTAPYQLLPDLTPEEFAALKEDIRARGVCVPVEFDGDGNILDGHNRIRAWQELIDEGVDVPMYDQAVRHFESEDAKRDYVLSLNLKRRHLTPDQKAMLFARLRLPPFNMTLQQIANIANVGVGTVWRKLEELPEDVRATLDELKTVGKDGKVYPALYQVTERTLIPAEKAERDYTARGYTGSDQSAEIPPKFLVVITCTDEEQQAYILERLADEGWDMKAVVS